MPCFFFQREGGIFDLFVKVTPKASKNEIGGIGTTIVGGEQRDFIKIFVTAVPEHGKANEAVIRLISKSWKLSKAQIILFSGETTHFKTFRLGPLSAVEQECLLNAFQARIANKT